MPEVLAPPGRQLFQIVYKRFFDTNWLLIENFVTEMPEIMRFRIIKQALIIWQMDTWNIALPFMKKHGICPSKRFKCVNTRDL